MSAEVCPLCQGDGYRDGCEVCGRFSKNSTVGDSEVAETGKWTGVRGK